MSDINEVTIPIRDYNEIIQDLRTFEILKQASNSVVNDCGVHYGYLADFCNLLRILGVRDYE